MTPTIPKVVYQTWKTHNLPQKIVELRNYMKQMNPEYEFCLYDDTDIIDFISNYSPDIDDNDNLLVAYNSLAIGAAKADLWRYLVLYKYGGIYLDMDAIIIQPLDKLFLEVSNINSIPVPDIHGIITRENNQGIFNNWILIFEPHHPFMKLMIDYCYYHISSRSTNDILALTGPIALTSMLNEFYLWTSLSTNQDKNLNAIYLDDIEHKLAYSNSGSDGISNTLYDLTDIEFNKYFRFCGLCVYKKDMGEFAKCKHRYANLLYNITSPYWRNSLNTFTNTQSQL